MFFFVAVTCNEDMIDRESICSVLDITMEQCGILLDLFAVVTDEDSSVDVDPDTLEVNSVDIHRFVLFLLVHLYCYNVEKGPTADVWPMDQAATSQLEPSSPMYLTSRAYDAEAATAASACLSKSPSNKQHKWHLPSTRQHMNDHTVHIEAVLQEFDPWLYRYAEDIVRIIARKPSHVAGMNVGSEGEETESIDGDDLDLSMDEDALEEEKMKQYEHTTEVDDLKSLDMSASDVDRLGFLLTIVPAFPQDENKSEKRSSFSNYPYQDSSRYREESHDNAQGLYIDKHPLETGQPIPTSRKLVQHGVKQGLSSLLDENLWHTMADSETRLVPTLTFLDWIKEHLKVENAGLDTSKDASMLGVSPPHGSVFNALITPTLNLFRSHDVHSISRSTIIRGESDFEEIQRKEERCINIVDCHDAIIYCLAPLQYVNIAACSDCVIILGGVGRAVHISRCERIQVMAASRSLIIETCRDCIFYFGVNRPPIMLGDNRFIQMAPHNAGYEYLKQHMKDAGVQSEPNYWSEARILTHHHSLSPSLSSQLAHGFEAQTTEATVKGNSMDTQGAEGDSIINNNNRRIASLVNDANKSPFRKGRASYSAPPAPVTLLPPSKLVPITVPFRGGPGRLCGGPAMQGQVRTSNMHFNASETDNNHIIMAKTKDNLEEMEAIVSDRVPGDDPFSGIWSQGFDPGLDAFNLSPFPLPSLYASAWKGRINGFVAFRNLYREAGLNDEQKRQFMSAVQSNFRDWLHSIGCMREVYDLARAEKELRNSKLGSDTGNDESN